MSKGDISRDDSKINTIREDLKKVEIADRVRRLSIIDRVSRTGLRGSKSASHIDVEGMGDINLKVAVSDQVFKRDINWRDYLGDQEAIKEGGDPIANGVIKANSLDRKINRYNALQASENERESNLIRLGLLQEKLVGKLKDSQEFIDLKSALEREKAKKSANSEVDLQEFDTFEDKEHLEMPLQGNEDYSEIKSDVKKEQNVDASNVPARRGTVSAPNIMKSIVSAPHISNPVIIVSDAVTREVTSDHYVKQECGAQECIDGDGDLGNGNCLSEHYMKRECGVQECIDGDGDLGNGNFLSVLKAKRNDDIHDNVSMGGVSL